MNLLVVFIVLNVLNVIIQTVKSIATIKCGKGLASIVNAVAYGLYTVVLVYMTCELSTALKAIIVALCNLVGVYIVKWFEERSKRDKVWKIEATVPAEVIETMKESAHKENFSFNVIRLEKYGIFNFYSLSQEDSRKIRSFLKFYNAKYFVTENRGL